jgi:hypothetical protein
MGKGWGCDEYDKKNISVFHFCVLVGFVYYFSVFCRPLLVFFLLAIALSVRLRITASDQAFGGIILLFI